MAKADSSKENTEGEKMNALFKTRQFVIKTDDSRSFEKKAKASEKLWDRLEKQYPQYGRNIVLEDVTINFSCNERND